MTESRSSNTPRSKVGARPQPSATVFAPATVSNLGMGFDVIGLALKEPGDIVTVRLDREGESDIRIVNVSGLCANHIPREAEKNTAAIAARATLARAGVQASLEIELHKGIPGGSGIGSSGASAAAAAFATNEVLGAPLRTFDLVEPCVEAEEAVAGRHADNVAASLIGGLIIVRSLDPLDLVRPPVPEGLWIVVVTPEYEMLTREAREVLPEVVPLASVVRHSADIAGFVSACYTGDLNLLSRCINDDIIEPVRSQLIPGAQAAIDAALASGALGSSISGSGPSIFALCHSVESAHDVAAAIRDAFMAVELESTTLISLTDAPGARLL